MTTANSLAPPNANGTGTIPPAPQVDPLAALAASYDIQDVPAPLSLPLKPQAAEPAPAPVTPAPAAPAATPQPRHPAWLSTRAAEFGVHPLILERLETAELTQLVMDTMRARMDNQADVSRQAVLQGTPQGQPAPVAADATPPPVPQGPPPFVWGEFDDYDEVGQPNGKKKAYTDADINPAIAHHIKKLNERIEKQEQFLRTMALQATNAKDRAFEREFDAAFNAFPDLFGQGDATAVQAKPDFFERRKAIFGAVKGMFRAMPPEVAARMSIKDGVFAMTKTMFGKDPPAAAAAAAVPAGHPGQSFAGAGLAPPTNRQPSNKPHGPERAKDSVRQWWGEQEANSTAAEGDTTLDEFVP